MGETYSTFYQSDWGSEAAARAARDALRTRLVQNGGAQGIVRGTVNHPLYGRGFEVCAFRGNGGHSGDLRDLRMMPTGFDTQRPPSLVDVEERWEEVPTWWKKPEGATR